MSSDPRIARMSPRENVRIAYLHWHPEEAAERAERLAEAGYEVRAFASAEGAVMQELRAGAFAAIAIDLGRLPSHGRAVALALRGAAATRAIPLFFFAGDAEKTEQLRAELPEAAFGSWESWRSALRRAIAAPPASPGLPRSSSGPSGTPLWQKLGARPNARVLVIGAPPEFETRFAELPEGTELRQRAGGAFDLGLCFCPSRALLARRWDALVPELAAGGALWIAWPKKASGVASDLDGELVRAHGLERGLVDTKVCAIDATWSGLRFQRRRT